MLSSSKWASVIIESVSPQVDGGRFPAKRLCGERVEVSAKIFTAGADLVAGALRSRRVCDETSERGWNETPLRPRGNDRFEAHFEVPRVGRYEFTVGAWIDSFSTWREGLRKKVTAGVEVSLELLEGAAFVRAAAERARDDPEVAAWLADAAVTLADRGEPRVRQSLALSDRLSDAMARHPDRTREARDAPVLSIEVERERAGAGAWYEFFPRSCSPETGIHGTLRDAVRRLEHAASLGFDVVYLPPIHPIGTTHRKGANNALEAKPSDPGSPWAIGAGEGGHKSVHPELGSLADFDALVAKAQELGLEIALDLAFQCSPDHPYVEKHPEWFKQRADGSIQYAENPPKKYQDIYPLCFETSAWRELWDELASVVYFWVERGVRIFRVDNPHTKPFAFWDWLIREVRAIHPDVIFLAEAFTRPAIMARLAKLGFSQSYTYFTWRNTKHELTEYLTQLTQSELREFFRPNFFVNTPDILHEYLQTGGRPAFQARLVLAATLSATYGVYGPPFELCVGEALPDTEEYRDSEKFQLRHWDLAAAQNICELVALVNRIRRENPALRSMQNLCFCPVDNETLLAYLRWSPDRQNIILVVVNLDPHHTQSGFVELPLDQLDIETDRSFQVHDLLGQGRYLWNGPRNFVALDPRAMPAQIFRVRRRVHAEQDFDYYL